jgi:1-acyl-sn-glycerol-3-phosphate acyltransferase
MPGVSDGLIAAILAFLGNAQDLLPLEAVRAELEREIQRAGPGAVLALKNNLSVDTGWDYYARDPLAQRIHHLLAGRFLADGSSALNAEILTSLDGGPIVIVANHLSYSDANAIEVLLHRAGVSAVANRLTAVAGPKVFTSRERRFSSLCFGTIKVPQSADVASGEAVLDARDVARAARRAIDVAHQRLAAGDVLLLFPEGTRSRTAGMQPMLPAVARYFEPPGIRIVPAGLTGSEALFPVDGALRAACVMVRFGPPIQATDLFAEHGRDRRAMMDTLGRAVADLLPSRYRGVYER